MSFLALPREIMLEIVECLLEYDPDYLLIEDVENFTWRKEHLRWCRMILPLMGTCRALRAAALPYFYIEVTITPDLETQPWHGVLRDYKSTARYVRKLCYIYNGIDSSSHGNSLQDLVSQCTGLQSLIIFRELFWGHNTEPPAQLALGWVPPESRRSLKYLHIDGNLKDVLWCLKNVATLSSIREFSNLQYLRLDSLVTEGSVTGSDESFIFDPVIEARDFEVIEGLTLDKVRNLRLGIEFEPPKEFAISLAKLLPNVESLHLRDTSRKVTHAVLAAYVDLGANITELIIDEGSAKSSEHLCEPIAKLSRKLKKLDISTNINIHSAPTFCHILFKNVEDWPVLSKLNLEANGGCAHHGGSEGVDSNLMYLAMKELIRIHPEASISLKVRAQLVRYSPGGSYNHVEPQSLFEKYLIPEIPAPDTGPDVEYHLDYNDEFDDYDFENDIEDAVESYYEFYSDDDNQYYEEYDDLEYRY